MLNLKNITLLGLDCINLDRLKIARDICVKDIEFGAVKLLTSIESDDKDVIKIDHIGSIDAYSEFMIRKLNPYVQTDFVLIFQHDGFILSANNWRNEFLSYDYIATPWIGYYQENPEHNVGNGGFSLRSKKLLEILATDPEIKIGAPEDIIISRQFRAYLEMKGITYAPEEIAGKFAIPDIMHKDHEPEPGITDRQYREYLRKQGIQLDSKETEEKYYIPQAYNVGDLPWTDQFGFHYLMKGHLEKWLEQSPQYKGIIKPKD